VISDRYRSAVGAVALFLLIAGSAYWTWRMENRPEGYWAALEAPAAWDGREVTLSLFAVESIDDDGHYVLRKSDRRALVEGQTADLRVGDELYVKGAFRASDGRIVETWRVVAEDRPGKWKLAAAALLFLAAALPWWFTVREGRLALRA
jgi:hypothetical protein